MSNGTNGNQPWAKIVSFLVLSLIGLVAYVWTDHRAEFRDFRKDVNTRLIAIEILVKGK